MYPLIYGFLFFCIAFLFHLIVWRIRVPENPIRVLLVIFYSVLSSGLMFLWFYQVGSSLFGSQLAFGYLNIVLFFTAMTFTYCLVHQFLVDDAPSLITIMSIFNAGKSGMSKTELSALITDDIFIKPRIEFLVKEQMVQKLEDNYLLAPKGYRLLSIFMVIQKIMKISQKPG